MNALDLVDLSPHASVNKPWFQRALAVPQPIFILASPRSFTSLVCTMLGCHPDAYGVPEVNLFTQNTLFDLQKASRFERQFMIHGLLRTVAQLYAGEQTIQTIEMAHRWIHKRGHLSVEEVYIELCEKVAPCRIVDKSPAYTMKLSAMNKIRDTFPGAHYIYMTRHPKDQGKSTMSAPQGIRTLLASNSFDYTTTPPTMDPQLIWYKTQRQVLSFLETIPKNQQHRFKGEQLLNDPYALLKEMCARLDLRWSDEIYQRMIRTEASPYACMGPFGCQAGNNPGFQKSPKFRPRTSPVRVSELDGPLPWRKDGAGFKPEIKELARFLGYQ